jgi:hypothetical protein
MLGIWRYARSGFFLAIFLLIGSPPTETPDKEAFLRGSTPFDLRADPDVEQPPRSNLKFAERVVFAAGVQKVSVRQQLLRFVNEAAGQTRDAANSSKVPEGSKESTQKTAPPAPAKAQPPVVKAKTPESRSKTSSSAKSAIDSSQEQKNAAEKPPSILQMLEGHETELMIAAAIAATSFLIGWLCGGHYSLRRDRRRRTKIRF